MTNHWYQKSKNIVFFKETFNKNSSCILCAALGLLLVQGYNLCGEEDDDLKGHETGGHPKSCFHSVKRFLGVTQVGSDSKSVDFSVLVAALVGLVKSLDAHHVTRTLCPFLVHDLQHGHEEQSKDQSSKVRLTICARFSGSTIPSEVDENRNDR